ncbi:MAG: DUF2779 domain-containing protein [Lentisphaeria bacterium]|nr:DUF2779 domain-containing protein [Lentisphaeria bacterium]
MLYLSKSKYCSAYQCFKMLWLQTNKPEVFDESMVDQAVMETGNKVGDIAMSLLGEYAEVPFGDPGEMVQKTADLLERGIPVITEGSFSFEGKFCSVDILKNLGGGEVEIYEVKSSGEVKEIHRVDAAYQNYVLTKLGFKVKKVCIVHINKEYIRSGELDLQQLFKTADVTDTVKEKFTEIENNIEKLTICMQQTEEPADDIGLHCSEPHACGFWKYCTRHLPSPNVFDITGRLSQKKKFEFYKQKKTSFEDLKNCDFSPAAKLQIEHELFDLPPHIEKDQIRKFLSQLSYPLYFLDFESFQPVVPLYDNSFPREQIVFQYSLHYIESANGELKHTEFLADPGSDPRRKAAEQLCRDIPQGACILAYNAVFEKGRIKRLAELYPDLKEHLMALYNCIQDLMQPFQQKHYYCREMRGSYSIKQVLPALFPTDPELDYHNLNGVHNGGEASAAFENMANLSAAEQENVRKQLLEYCKLDTLAMVKIWQKLSMITSEKDCPPPGDAKKVVDYPTAYLVDFSDDEEEKGKALSPIKVGK